MTIFLRDYQKEAISALYSWLETNNGNALLVLPTGSGKSLIQAKIFEDALCWPNQRVLSITHVRELISQNFSQLLKLWPEAPAGIYCSGLDKKQSNHPITFASIQSIYKKIEEIGWRDLIVIDECHLVGDHDKTMYRTFLNGMKTINPNVRIIGLSATPFRLKSGYLHEGEGALFSDIAFEITLSKLIKEGFLSPLTSKAAVTQGNTKGMSIKAGEFAIKEVITEFDREELTTAAVNEMMQYGHDRKTWLIFCVSIEHAQHICDALNENGINCETISEKTPAGERARILADFKDGRIRAVTNVAVLTTGLDVPSIDLLVLLRPTMSPGLLIQMCGRAMRLSPGKENGLILDLGGNFERHGPITHIKPKNGIRKNEQKKGKTCPKCREVCPIQSMECITCGYIFEGQPLVVKHAKRASHAEVMSDAPVISNQPQWFIVSQTIYEIHEKVGSQNSLKVTYIIPHNRISEYVCFGHSGYAREKAVSWWLARGGGSTIPRSAREAMERIKEISSIHANKIRAKKEDKWLKIVSYSLRPSTSQIRIESGNIKSMAIQEANNVVTA